MKHRYGRRGLGPRSWKWVLGERSQRRTLLEAEPDDEEEDEGDDLGEEEPEAEEELEPAEPPDPDPEPELEPGHAVTPEDSLDNQIDALLIGFEREAVVDDVSESLRLRDHFAYLFEAEDDDEEMGDDSEKTSDNAEPSDVAPADPPKPNINIDEFAQRVARLINNYDSLLDVPGAIFDRARKFLEDNYDEGAAEELEEILAQQHGIHAGDSGEAGDAQAPAAYGAEGVPSATGGGGGDIDFGGGGGEVGGIE